MDAIVSTGPPHSMHLIARKLSLATGIPWVADFRDPWTRMFYFKHLGLTGRSERRHHKLEKQVLDDASVIVAVSPPVQRDFQSMTDTPVRLITHGYDESDYESCPEEATDGYFRISHTGLFAADGIPETLWRVLADKSEADEDFSNALRICLAGKTDSAVIHSIRMAGLGEKLVDRGYQPHLEAVREQIRHVAVFREIAHTLGTDNVFRPLCCYEMVELVKVESRTTIVNESSDAILLDLASFVVVMVVMVVMMFVVAFLLIVVIIIVIIVVVMMMVIVVVMLKV